VDVRAVREANQIVVSVKDSGIGIPETEIPKIFEKFYRVKNKDTAKITGTGLGLAIVRSIAELHHGRAWVESCPGQGSKFYLALPLTAPPRATGPGTSTA
jgi:signal transduction histidine kinase